LAEAESELVAGFHTEYSGLRWSFFFMAEYGSMLSVSLLASILFLGGWHGPIPIATIFGLTPENGAVAGYLGSFLGMTNVLFKAVIGVSVMMWVRWTLPRLRIDQVMATCLKYCTPIAAAMFLGAVAWQYTLPGRNFFGLLAAPAGEFAVTEGWERLPAAAAASTSKSDLALSPRESDLWEASPTPSPRSNSNRFGPRSVFGVGDASHSLSADASSSGELAAANPGRGD
jgi:NADH-quinone oxidoreductase subunit H